MVFNIFKELKLLAIFGALTLSLNVYSGASFNKDAYLNLNQAYAQPVVQTTNEPAPLVNFMEGLGSTLRTTVGTTNQDNLNQIPARFTNNIKTQAIQSGEKYINKKANDLANQSGWGRTEISLRKLGSDDMDYSIKTLQPLHKLKPDSSHLTFIQTGISSNKTADETRAVFNFGVGQRYLLDSRQTLIGVNLFTDYESKSKHQRASLGFEFQRTSFRANMNTYFPITDKVVVGENTEEALAGYDIKLSEQFPYLPWMRLKAELYGWDYTESEDVTGTVLGVEVSLTKGSRLELGYEDTGKEDEDASAYVRLSSDLSFKDNSKFSNFGFADTAFASGDIIHLSDLNWVERNNKIRVEVLENITVGTLGEYSATTSGATCTLYNASGVGLGTITTNDLGQGVLENLSVPKAGLISMTCEGGTYTDEATQVAGTQSPALRAATIYSGEGAFTLVASPLSEIAYQLAGSDIANTISSKNALVATAFSLDGIDITATIPTDLNTTVSKDDNAGKVGLVLAAISQMAENAAHDSTPSTSATTFANDTILELIADMSDNVISGVVDSAGATVNLSEAIENFVNGTGANNDSQGSSNTGDVGVQLAIDKISAYAGDNSKPAPTVEDYSLATVTGVDAANLSAVNAKIAASNSADVDSVSEVQVLADAGNNTADSLAKIIDYANNNGSTSQPNEADYTNIGVELVGAVLTLNNNIADSSGAEVDDADKIQIIANESVLVSFELAQSNGAESENVSLKVALDFVSPQDVVVNYTLTGTASGSGVDYTHTDSSLTIAAGNISTNIDISINDDNTNEDGETIIVKLSTPSKAGLGSIIEHTYTINDNDSPSISLTNTTGLTTTEAGGTASFNVALNTQPTANVTLTLSSSNTDEGTIFPDSLTFTTDNWNVVQVATITGVDDNITDEDTNYQINLNVSSDDGDYSSLSALSIDVVNTDNDTAGVTVGAISGNTSEDLTTATFTVQLDTQPNNNVAILLDSSNTSEGTVSPASLEFTTDNWNVQQIVTITGVNDDITDEDTNYQINLKMDTSADSAYAALTAITVDVVNVDNDAAGITIGAVSGDTSEDLETATFEVALNTQPLNKVVIVLSSNNTSEGTVSPASLEFTTDNWNVQQAVTITGVNDGNIDGDITYQISLDASTSPDDTYRLLSTVMVDIVNIDNDAAGLVVSNISANTSEDLSTASFTVGLNTKPTANVVLNVSSSDTSEGSVSTDTLTFTAANWETLQTVTITGVDDDIMDGDIDYTIQLSESSSADETYNALEAMSINVTNTDNDTVGIVVSQIDHNTTENGNTANFTVKINSQPTAEVKISVATSENREGLVSINDDTPAASLDLIFTADNWKDTQTVIVTGVDDDEIDGNTDYQIILGSLESEDTNYSNLDTPAPVAVTNEDNDVAGIASSNVDVNTTEDGGVATFSVSLNTQPDNANVTITLSSSNEAEGTVSPSSLIFTSVNWSEVQTVTITGVDDDVMDGDTTYQINISSPTSTDQHYKDVSASSVDVINEDNDTAGISLSKTAISTSEEGLTTDTFDVQLTSKPGNNVSIAVESADTGEGTVSPANLEFTTDNWDTPQTITVAGVDDNVMDDDTTYKINLTAKDSIDEVYKDLTASLDATNIDNDNAGISVSRDTQNTVEVEADAASSTDTFTVVLDSKPVEDVVITATSGDTTEGVLSVEGGDTAENLDLTFTADNWNTPQEITLTSVNDDVMEAAADTTYEITFAINTSDGKYGDLEVVPVPSVISATNADNNTAQINVSETDITTSEDADTATFTVALNSEPTDNVTISVESNDATEGLVSIASLTFTADNWDDAQIVTITGVDDDIIDTDTPYHIALGKPVSDDGNYVALNAPNVVNVINTDNDTAGISLINATDLTTTESGGSASFEVQLSSKPSADVTIDVSSSDTTEGSVSPASLIFTADNWNVSKIVTVKGIDDKVDENADDIAYKINLSTSSSNDNNYSNISATTDIVNEDNDVADISFSNVSGTTTEDGGTATFTVALNSEPTHAVTITVESEDATEGKLSIGDATPATNISLTFTADNWNTQQTIIVTGVLDNIDDGNITYQIKINPPASSDDKYRALSAKIIEATNIDNNIAEIVLSKATISTAEEGLTTDSFTVKLNSQPTASVTIDIGDVDDREHTVSESTLDFTVNNWDVPQTVTITGVDDNIMDDNVTYNINFTVKESADKVYSALTASLSATNIDNDNAGITVSKTTLSTSEVEDSADSSTDAFSVVLDSEPKTDVTITVASTDDTEGLLSIKGSDTATANLDLTFTADNWNTPQEITLTSVNDDVMDTDITYEITFLVATNDGKYASTTIVPVPSPISVINTDNNTAKINVSKTDITTSEEGLTIDTFDVVLESEPTGTVMIAVESDDISEGVVSPASLTFTAENWDTAQTVTITGVDDLIDDDDETYSINLTATDSADTIYQDLTATLSATNTDNDAAGIAVSGISSDTRLITSENGDTATFDVVLESEPTDVVVISVESDNPQEGTASPADLTFTADNWNTAQTVTITGENDNTMDESIDYSVKFSIATTDEKYSDESIVPVPNPVKATNNDNDVAGITVAVSSNGLTTTEGGGEATFTVALDSSPLASASVAITLSSSDVSEGTVSPASLEFDASNWNIAQTVTITGIDDATADADIAYQIILGKPISADSHYSFLNAPDAVDVENIDNDSAGIEVSDIVGGTSENSANDTATFTVKLTSKPTTSVIVNATSNDTSEGTASPSSLTFGTDNWDTPQTVTVTGKNDAIVDGDKNYKINLTVANLGSVEEAYRNLNQTESGVIVNVDDDTPDVKISEDADLITTESGGTASFKVALGSEPTEDVTITLSSSDTTEGTVSPSVLTFTSNTWNNKQTVIIKGVDDGAVDNDVAYRIDITVASTDSNYNGFSVSSVVVTNTDDDFSISLASASVDESVAFTSEAPEIIGNPVGTVVYSMGGVDAHLFSLNTSTGILTLPAKTFATPEDDGGNNVYSLTLIATSGDDSFESVDWSLTVKKVVAPEGE